MTIVEISELRAAAEKLRAAVNTYGDATTATDNAARTLIASWEGDAEKVFEEEQTNAILWYRKVAEAVNAYISAILAAAEIYEQLDIDGVNLIIK